ncbi:putative leucine-rich repeat-containing protein DDB_G0290503 isoform X2 [Colias croceus]|uniref:putative leucine-rich repeat-containing protein DDB_G0290503 isoform X2 n=1 Tax=Colias crocea TaxID=72248 RepID=UPI001E280DE4|nr:putative leucine-rich repeat-containing protein DDB_G0290503 isoform X2 [Colias croceus]
MAHVEPMDLDCIESDFDDKENSYQHNNALPRVSCAEKGFEELDVSEFNMKLRYQVTPASSPMSKSYTANCLDNRNISSVEDVLTNNQNLTRSLNATITNSDSILKSPKSLPLQSISTDQFTDLNRNSSVRRSLDTAQNNVTVTITTPQDLDDSLSLPSTSSSLTHTPEATTPTKEIPKHDGGSPILRGLKSVFSMFRSSQSPIPPNDETNVERKDETFSEVPVKDTKPQTVLASTPIRSKNSPIKSGSPLKDSVTFKDDLERELQWRDDSTIIFKEEKIPIHKLFLPTLPIETKAVQELKKDNVNTTVEYMDISMNESAINESVKNIKYEVNNTIESDSEFQDCETTFTKNEDDLEEKADVNANVGCIQDDINMSIVENEYNEIKPEEPPIESIGNKTIDVPIECTISGAQTVAEDDKLNLTNNLETNTKLEDVVPGVFENVDNKNKAEEEILLETPSISNTTLNRDNLQCEQNLSAIINELNEISSDAKCVEDNLVENVNNKHESNGICNQSNINMSIVENDFHEVNQSKNLLQTQVENNANANETTNLENPIVENIIKEDIIPEGLKLDETVNIEASSKLLNSTSPDINESSQTKNQSDTQIGEEGVTHKEIVDETTEKTITSELDETDYKLEQSLHADKISTSNEVTNDIKTDSRMELNSMQTMDDLHENIISNEIALENITELQTTNVVNNSVDQLHKLTETSEIPKHEDIEQNTNQNIDEALILTNKSECLPTLSNEEKVDITPSLSNLLVENSIHTPDIQTHVENITEIVVKGNTLSNNIQSEAIIDPAKTMCSNTEISSNNVINEFEEENQLVKNDSLVIPVDRENVNDKTVEINSENLTIETKCTDVNCVNTSNAENTTLSHIDAHVVDSKPSDIPLPFDDENMPSLNNEIEITNKANTNDEEAEMQVSDLPGNTTIIQESLNIEGDSNVESTISQNNIDNFKTLHALETPIEPEILPEVVDSNEIEVKIENIETASSSDANPEICNATLKVDREDDPNKIKVTETGHNDLAIKNVVLPQNDCISKITSQENAQNITSNADVSTTNEANQEPIINNAFISLGQENKEELIEPPANDPHDLETDMEVDNINECKEINPFETKCKIVSTPPGSPVISSKGTVTTKKDDIEEEKFGFNNDLPREDKPSDCSNIMGKVNVIETTPDAHILQVNKINNVISTKEANNLKNDVENEHSNNSTQISDERKNKNVFNLPEIDDKNFNPFATRSKICVSPTPESSSFVHDKTATFDIHNSTEIKISTGDEDANLAANINSSDISNITTSSKHTNEKDATVKEIHTEDEDTIEGPFLEAEDLADFEKDTDILPDSERDDMIGFDDFPPQTNEDNGDNAEIFIDAQAFEFLLNQNTSNVVADSGKESLFLKFDPLFAKRVSSDGILAALNKAPKRVSTPKKKTQHIDNNLQTNDSSAGTSSKVPPAPDTADDINMNVSKPTMVVNPAVNSIISPRKAATPPKINRQSLSFTSPAMAVIDRLLSLSGNGNSSSLNHDTSMPQVSAEQHHTDSALIQLREMLAEKEIHVQTLRAESKELKERLSVMESQVRSLETESQDRLRKITDLNEKLADKIKVNKTMSTVVEEYERTIASLVAELEQDKRRNAEERMKLIRDRDEQTAHLASMEVSFSDLHSKYEKSKQIIFSLKANEDTCKKSIKEFEENLVKMQNNYELLKQHATSKLNHANTELEKMNKAHEAEVLKLNAMIKRKDLHITSLEETLAQKTKANEELTAICDELINKVG